MSFPEDLRLIAGSIFPNGNPSTTRNHLAAEIINRIVISENQYGKKEILNRYKKRLMMIGKRVLVTGARETFEAMAIDIDDLGQLVVKKDSGETLSLSAGEISIR